MKIYKFTTSLNRVRRDQKQRADRKPKTMGRNQNITAEEVISKIKDDGDFDRLRLKIIRQLKQNEDLRNSIISVVKQSTALNSDGAENMKPRQLCDKIHDEVREKVMSQISDDLWRIIRSGDGMKNEITETVQAVYDKLLNPKDKAKAEFPCSSGQVPERKGADSNGAVMVSGESSGTLSDGEPPGFCLHNHDGSNLDSSRSEAQQHGPNGSRPPEPGREPHRSNGSLKTENGNNSPPPRSKSRGKRKHPSDGSDEDPDIPPGFG